MSQGNVEVVRRWVEAYNNRAIESLMALSTSDIEFRSRFAGMESGGVFRGYPGMADYFKSIEDAYEHFDVLPDQYIDAGAAVLVIAHADWRGRESGAAARTPVFPVVWLRAGEVFRVETFADEPAAREAVGLSA